MRYLESVFQSSNRDCSAITDSVALLEQNEYPKDEIEFFTGKAVRILDNCSNHHGMGTRFRYTISKHLGRVRLRIIIQGSPYNPLSDEDETIDSLSEYVTQLFLHDQSAFVSYKRLLGKNIITLGSAVKPRKSLSFKSPLIWAIALGVIFGLICQRLPDNIHAFLVDSLADPIGSVVLALIAGASAPVIFLSLITSITSLGSINRLTELGFKIMWRFIKCTLFIIGVSTAVSLLFYSVFGAAAIRFNPDQLISMLLKLIPTNIIAPFLNNDMPQLVILGLVLGAALLLLDDRVDNLNASLRALREWSMSVM